jgi:hypothetical protein
MNVISFCLPFLWSAKPVWSKQLISYIFFTKSLNLLCSVFKCKQNYLTNLKRHIRKIKNVGYRNIQIRSEEKFRNVLKKLDERLTCHMILYMRRFCHLPRCVTIWQCISTRLSLPDLLRNLQIRFSLCRVIYREKFEGSGMPCLPFACLQLWAKSQ